LTSDGKEAKLAILQGALDLSKSISKYRQDMDELEKNKGSSDSDVI